MNKIWLVGAGNMAKEYVKALISLKQPFTIIGRSAKKSTELAEELGVNVESGGINSYIKRSAEVPVAAIVAVNVEELANVVKLLIRFGVKRILVEKPGFCCPDEINEICDVASYYKASVYIAYNRHFFSSVIKAKEVIAEDGGVKSFSFEFTEWRHVIDKIGYNSKILNNWFYANSSHVVDLAFFLGGEPTKMQCYTSGNLWGRPSVFSGAGVSNSGALFSYQANWNSPGRWRVELLTSKHRLYLCPLENLQIQNIGSLEIVKVDFCDLLDRQFKPGLFLETRNFINGNTKDFVDIFLQKKHISFFNKILGV